MFVAEVVGQSSNSSLLYFDSSEYLEYMQSKCWLKYRGRAVDKVRIEQGHFCHFCNRELIYTRWPAHNHPANPKRYETPAVLSCQILVWDK